MKINDLEKLTGLKRSNIFYYEREGLLVPKREDNNYREYAEDDLRRLKTIVVLRKLGFTVAEIKSLLDGERTLPDILPENMTRLAEQSAELDEALALCREMARQNLTMADFDADAWFETIENEEKQGRRFLDFMGDVADDVTRTMAFVQDSIGLQGPVWALYFLSEEGIRKRRLWKWYWISWLLSVFWLLAYPMLLPGAYMRPAHPWAALAFAVVEGVAGSLALLFCARYVIPGRKPRQAFWLTVGCVLCAHLLLYAAGRPALEMTVDEEKQQTYLANMGESSGAVEDPLAYVQTEYNEKYYGGKAELRSWQAEDRMFVFSSWGVTFEFRRQGDGSWLEVRGVTSPTESGTLYTADPYGPEPYPSRLMLSDGTVVEPVYEARFDTGYIPLFAFDVSHGETCRGILFGVDETGGLRYELRTEYAIAPERTMAAYYNQPGFFRQYGAYRVWGTADGPAFLAAWGDFRRDLWQTAPDVTLDTGSLGVDSSYVLWAEHIAPPSLVVMGEGSYVPDDWGLMEYNEILYYRDEETYPRIYEPGYQYKWDKNCWGDITALLTADTVTPALLRQAAQTVLGMGETGATFAGFTEYAAPYAETRTWNGLEAPEELVSLGLAVRRELGG